MDPTIADTHGIRVTAVWLTEDDLFPTYAGLLQKHTPPLGPGTPTYAGLVHDYPTFEFMLNNAGFSGTEYSEDITCDVTGLRIRRGRLSVTNRIDASTLSMTLKDETGKHDPRRPPVSNVSRTGAKITVEVAPENVVPWVPIFTGFVETWGRTVNAGEDQFSEITATCADAFSLFARAVPKPPDTPLGSQIGHQRVLSLLGYGGWLDKWGGTDVSGGYVNMSPTKLGDDVLDSMWDVTFSEDGMMYVEPNGDFYWYGQFWRGTRRRNLVAFDITGGAPDGFFDEADVCCPSSYVVTDDDIDLINQVVVWRDRESDAVPTPPPVKYGNVDTDNTLISIARHGVVTREYDDLPHASDGQSQYLADRYVDRFCREANRVGEFVIPLVKRYGDAGMCARLAYGDEIKVWDDTVTGTPQLYRYELVGMDHNITPDEWTMTFHVDNWIDVVWPDLFPASVSQTNPATGATPGVFLPYGATVPPNLTQLQLLGPLGQGPGFVWSPGNFVWLGDGSRAHWEGSLGWRNGAMFDPTGVTNGIPGQFTPAGVSIIPLNLDVLKAIGPLGETTKWNPGEYVALQNGTNAHWNGTGWVTGRVPPEGRSGAPGTPGTFAPTGYTAATVNALSVVLPVPSTAWPANTWVPLTGPDQFAHWNGNNWVVGKSPGYDPTESQWGIGDWGDGVTTWR